MKAATYPDQIMQKIMPQSGYNYNICGLTYLDAVTYCCDPCKFGNSNVRRIQPMARQLITDHSNLIKARKD